MPQSDYIFLLDADPELSQSRKEKLRDRYEADLPFLNRVSSVYNALAVPGRWFAIDANQPRETIHYEISKLAMALIENGLTSSSRGTTS